MKVFLMFRDRDFGVRDEPPLNATDLIQDLELNTLFGAMSGGDKFLLEVAKKGVLASLRERDQILYRQGILIDCLGQPEIVRAIYALTVKAIERERKVWGWMSARYPDSTLSRADEVLKMFVEMLKKLRQLAEEYGSKFSSEGFCRLFGMLTRELDDQYLAVVEDHLQRLKFHKGILISAVLGRGHKGANYILRKPVETEKNWLQRLEDWLPFKRDPGYFYEVAERDETGFRVLSELKGRGIVHVASALAQSTDHILSFFQMLRLELGFYIACLNLRDHLAQKSEPICIPGPFPAGEVNFSGRGLYDVCLSLTVKERIVGNDVDADGKWLVMITGANRGGKSTFLRSVGLAQLMMQSGMFVSAESLHANICHGIFTHFKREEDATMKSGKLDEELRRMSLIIDQAATNGLVLFNESFASTNEREGSEIARQIVSAMLESNIKVFYVTHLFDLAQRFFTAKMDNALFLRAERLADGRRTFRLVPGEPLPTSFGEDLYKRIFEKSTEVLISPVYQRIGS